MRDVIEEYWWYYAILGVFLLVVLLFAGAATYNTFFGSPSHAMIDRAEEYCQSIGKEEVELNLAQNGDDHGTFNCTK